MTVQFKTPDELFAYKLGSALRMENDTLDMLAELEETAQRKELKEFFKHHQEETREQVSNLEKVFEVLGEPAKEHPSPTTKGMKEEGKKVFEKTDEALIDSVVLAAALGTEHYETAVYETLITHAEAMGAKEVVDLLKQNLEQETHTADEIKKFAQKVAEESVRKAGASK